jgi:hypothetical protein
LFDQRYESGYLDKKEVAKHLFWICNVMTFNFVGEKDGVVYDNGGKKHMKVFIRIIFRATMISIIKFRNIYPSGNRISSQKSTLIERGTEYKKRCIDRT